LVSNFEKLAEVFKNLGRPCVLLVGPTLAGPLEMRWPMNGTSRDKRRFDSEMDELSKA